MARVPAVLREVGDRLVHDLRLRFPDLTYEWLLGREGWLIRLTGLGDVWASSYLDEIDDWSERDREALLEELASNAADNAWPDEMTDPWPLCPRHRDHPLQVGLRAGRAVWYCLREPEVEVRVGSLSA